MPVALDGAMTSFTCDSGDGFNACPPFAFTGLSWEARVHASALGWRWWDGKLLCPPCAAAVKPIVSREPVGKNEPPMLISPVRV